jgi:hypothetical protein
MSSVVEFARGYGIKIMILGFALLAIGGVLMVVTGGDIRSNIIIGLGVVIYIIGRVLMLIYQKSKR